jgi:predicted negative regulator of RcsB-dependent stress response
MDGKSVIIGALAIAVAVMGYLYWDSRQNTVVKLPGVEIKKN